jgi:hypothetical protein
LQWLNSKTQLYPIDLNERQFTNVHLKNPLISTRQTLNSDPTYSYKHVIRKSAWPDFAAAAPNLHRRIRGDKSSNQMMACVTVIDAPPNVVVAAAGKSHRPVALLSSEFVTSEKISRNSSGAIAFAYRAPKVLGQFP